MKIRSKPKARLPSRSVARAKLRRARKRREVTLRYANCSVTCQPLPFVVESVHQYLLMLKPFVDDDGRFWFRGHADCAWELKPSALRQSTTEKRRRAGALLAEFKRTGELRLPKPPREDQELRWMQIARHHGLPTRLLDWTENPLVALYFACEQADKDGMVFVFSPVDLNQLTTSDATGPFDAELNSDIFENYLPATRETHGKPPVAIEPIINTERILAQRGAFTLHGSTVKGLDGYKLPTLRYMPVLHERKKSLLRELAGVGVDGMALFADLDHVCRYLTSKAGLET